MATEAGKFKLGLFILASLAVLVAVIVVLGSGRWFSRRVALVSFFDESIQGLDIGSPVKKQGVQIGRVVEVSLGSSRRLVRVDMEIDPSHFERGPRQTSEPEAESQRRMRELFARMVAEGLRSRLELSGITGMKYVDLDFYPDSEGISPRDLGDEGPAPIPIPSVTSSMRQLEASVMVAANRIAEVDFNGIAKQASELLQNVNRILTEPRLKTMMDDLQKSGESIRRAATLLDSFLDEATIRKLSQVRDDLSTMSTDMRALTTRANRVLDEDTCRRLVDDLGAATTRIRATVERLDRGLDSVDGAAALADARSALRETAQAAVAVGEMRTELRRSLRVLDGTLQAVRELADYLRQNPAALVRGKSVAPAEPQ